MSDELQTSEKPKRRGRPKKDLSDYHPKIDHARKLDDEKQEHKKQNTTVDEWLEESGDSVSMCRRKANGNVHRRFYFRKDKNPDLYKTLRKSKNWK